MLHALIFSDDTESVVRLSDVFRETGFAVRVVPTLREARAALLHETPDVALVDYDTLDSAGVAFLESSRLGDVIELLLITANPKLSSAVHGMQIGASDYFAKPVVAARLRAALEKIANHSKDSQQAACSGRRQAAALLHMHGNSRPMRRLAKVLRKVSPTNMTVLLYGESGVGKELAATAIHELSERATGPLVAVNCGAINAEILESELFGHEKGSFTGAARRHIGFFERASGGTLFLDEITEMSPALQIKLLRVLESGRLRRVGGEDEVAIDVRLVAATNRNPEEAVEARNLREDLYYRLAQFPIRIPPLRERGEDIELLADTFLTAMNESKGGAKSFTPQTLEAIRVYSWPGNVRELRNAIARAHLLAADRISPDDLPSKVLDGGPTDRDFLRITVGQQLSEVERRVILATVEHFDGDKKAAARTLGVSLKTIYTKLKKYRA
jgi:two-component system, NtrC family, response regulator AtoC